MSLPPTASERTVSVHVHTSVIFPIYYISAVHIFYLVCQKNVNVPDSIHYVYLRERHIIFIFDCLLPFNIYIYNKNEKTKRTEKEY